MKTINYNPETHVIVPREPSEEMCDAATADSCWENMNPPPSTAYRLMIAAAPQPEPVDVGSVGWKHDCAALCANDIELWIDRCPHCGKPRHNHPPTDDELLAALGSGGRHCNDDTPHSDLCEAIIDSKEADLGQGLDPFWKWAFRRGFHDAETSYKVDIATLEQQRDELLAELQRFMDSHEECTDFDGFTAQIVKPGEEK